MILCLAMPQALLAQAGSLFARGGGAGAAPLVALREAAVQGPQTEAASLFAGQTALLAPLKPRAQRLGRGSGALNNGAHSLFTGFHGSKISHLRHIISQAESRRNGYDAVQHGAKIKPSKRPTLMTIGQIYDWIDDTPGQPHAIGRYQFIPATLKRLVHELNVSHRALFTPQLQDRLADVLLVDAGIQKIKAGTMKRHTFMNNLAKIWAGLPTSSGKSHYDGYAGNKAAITWAYFDREMSKIFPG